MKKAVTLLTLMAGVGLALAQSVVSFVAELVYVDPASSSLTPFAASISRFKSSTPVSPGTWSGKNVTLPIGGLIAPTTLAVRVWAQGGNGAGGAGFATYEQAL